MCSHVSSEFRGVAYHVISSSEPCAGWSVLQGKGWWLSQVLGLCCWRQWAQRRLCYAGSWVYSVLLPSPVALFFVQSHLKATEPRCCQYLLSHIAGFNQCRNKYWNHCLVWYEERSRRLTTCPFQHTLRSFNQSTSGHNVYHLEIFFTK